MRRSLSDQDCDFMFVIGTGFKDICFRNSRRLKLSSSLFDVCPWNRATVVEFFSKLERTIVRRDGISKELFL